MKENTAALPAQYQSYLVRLWRETGAGHASWRASLENSRTGARVGFANLEQLFVYLMSQTEDRAAVGFVNTGDQIASNTQKRRKKMSDKNYTTSFSVDQTPQEVFEAINNVRGWWSELIEGDTDKLGAVVYYHHQDLHRCTFKIAELVPGKKVVWHVLQNYFPFVADKTEWTGTEIVFEIAPQGHQTELRFTHVGLVPQFECFSVCSDGWSTYIKGSLRGLITTGKGQPNVGKAITESEKALSKLSQ